MKRTVIVLIGLLMICTNLYAAGDLIVDGKLGVGTTNPGAKLDVEAGDLTGLYVTTQDGGPWGLMLRNLTAPTPFQIYEDNNGNTHMYSPYPNHGITLDVNGNVGIGIKTPASNKLYVDNVITDSEWGSGTYIKEKATAETDGAFYNHGTVSVIEPVVNTGITNSGYAIALEASSLYQSSESGTLNNQMGLRLYYGNYSTGAATINNAYGMFIVPKHDSGHIVNSYGLFIQEPTTGAIVDNHWGIYQSGTSKNYFGGNVGIGILNPAYDLDVSGTIRSYYLYPGLGYGDPYRYLRFGDETTYWAGFMWNNTSADYGDGDDFTIFTYDNRDIVLQPGSGKIVLSHQASSKVGIGTKSPSQKLDVIGNTYISGNVGIGTATPGAKLDVVGDVNVSGVVTADNIITSDKVGIGTNSPSQKLDVIGNTYISGNVGIGTATPGAKLDVVGDVNVSGVVTADNIISSGTDGISATGSIRTEGSVAIGSATTNSTDKLFVTTDSYDSTWGRGGRIVNNAYAVTDGGYFNQGLAITLNPVVNAGVTNSGYAMGLNVSPLYTSEEAGTLHIQTGIRAYYGNYDNCGGTCGAATIDAAYGINIAPRFDNGTITNSYALYISDPPVINSQVTNMWGIYEGSPDMKNYFAGQVGIGAYDQNYKLTVGGPISVTSVHETSDLKLKDNIKAIDTPLRKVMDMKGVSFNWKTEEYKDRHFPEGRHYGVIAQDVEKILPEVVKEGQNGEKSVAYTEIIPVLLEAVKEQQGRIEKQQNEIDALKAEIERLKPQKVAIMQ